MKKRNILCLILLYSVNTYLKSDQIYNQLPASQVKVDPKIKAATSATFTIAGFLAALKCVKNIYHTAQDKKQKNNSVACGIKIGVYTTVGVFATIWTVIGGFQAYSDVSELMQNDMLQAR